MKLLLQLLIIIIIIVRIYLLAHSVSTVNNKQQFETVESHSCWLKWPRRRNVSGALCLACSCGCRKFSFKNLISPERCWQVTICSNWCICVRPEAMFLLSLGCVGSNFYPFPHSLRGYISYWQLLLWLESLSLLLYCSFNDIKLITCLWTSGSVTCILYCVLSLKLHDITWFCQDG